ncbi:ABC transporter substrate-binding protein [Brevundimonas sp.]|uniref:ABC transporter substrate-binding protein n=1 Tax=Brevundimonas sp. TaxID=1871086 RepID=UPI0028A172B4|nr:ABC transporter substrate-binding protein [Brevundimonas sp.]
MALFKTKSGVVRVAKVLAATLALMIAPVAIADAPQSRIVIGVPLEPPHLDPTTGAAAAVDEITYANIFEGLTRLTPNGTVAPALAESWSASPDGLSWTFHLKRGVTFSDGVAFDAQTVRYALMRIVAEGSTNAQKALFAPIRAVDVVDAHTVTIRLSRPVANLPYLLAWGDASMVSPASVATNATAPVGTGPYRLHRWQRGGELELVRREDYWGRAPRTDRVVFRFISDPAAAFAAVRAGDVDAFPNYAAPETVGELRRNPALRVTQGLSEGKVIMAMNNARAPFNAIRVRRALSYAIDRKAIIDGAMFGFGQPIGSHYSRQAAGYVDLTDRYPHDVEKARQLLAEAGYPNGLDVTLRIPPRPYATRSSEVLVNQLAEAGVRVKIETLEWAQWLDQVFGRKQFDLTMVEHVEPMDYDIYGRKDYYFGYDSAAFDALLAQVNTAPDEAKRLALLGDLQRLIAEDAVNVFLFQSSRIGVSRNGVEGLWINSPIAANDMTGVHMEGAGAAASTRTASSLSWGWIIAVGLTAALAFSVWKLGAAWTAKRLLGHGLTLLAASVVIFGLLQVLPGDPAAYMMGLNASPEAIATLREQMGLNGGLVERYLVWTGGLLRGDFGTSYTYQTPVTALIGERLAVSLPLALSALALSVVIALPVGVLAARHHGKATGGGLIALMQAGIAIPNFWLGLLLILLFSVTLRWFPAGGYSGWTSLVLPAIALAAPQAAILARVLRTSLLDTLNEDYVRTARAKGLSRNAALIRHALPNAWIPVLTVLGLQAPFLLAGGVVIENVFSLPGLGRLSFQAVSQRDLIVVQGAVMVLVAVVVVVSLLVDIAYAMADPRQRDSDRSGR